MGANLTKSAFPVDGRTVVITGGSKGMGLQAARQLAGKGANVLIVARDTAVLKEAIQHVSKSAKNPDIQRFHYISADCSNIDDCNRIIAEATKWNDNKAPDILWNVAGTTHPTFFVDTPPEVFHKLMNINYFSCVYMSQAMLKAWLPDKDAKVEASPSEEKKPARHIIFTASFLSLYSVAGYAPYNPSKAAIRSLSDSLSQEMKLYEGAYPNEPKIKVHCIFPASILTEGFEEENLIKSDVTKLLEEADTPLTPEVVASNAIASLERGEELIATDFQTRLVMTSVLGGAIRGGFFVGFVNTLLAFIMPIVMLFVRSDMDSKVKKWGKKHGPSGMKKA